MKYKYALRNSLYLDEELQEYFNEMSKNGWRLDFVGYYYRFIKDEHVYKYQIDYTPASREYKDILEEMGYHEVDNSFEGFKVLENENVEAPDLNTEFLFDKNNKIEQFKKKRYFIYPVLAFFLFWLGKLFVKDLIEIGKPALYYEGLGSLGFGIIFIFLAIILLFITILNFSILYALKLDKDLNRLKKINKLKDYLTIIFSVITLISGIMYLCYSVFHFDLKFIIYMILVCIVGVILSRFVDSKYNSAIAAFVAIALCGILFPASNTQSNDSFFESWTVKTKITNYEKKVDYTTSDYPQLDIFIKKPQYKDEILKYVIIKTDHDTRDNLNYEKEVRSKSQVSWDSNKTHYYHYEKAIQSFIKKDNVYDNGTYEIKVLKNKIITKYIDNK
ncbi:MAG: DUF2812 domain-containing protein [Bacillota bacterium]|nr:DUF2812 domain-containing protein [Bacillota bacterium]